MSNKPRIITKKRTSTRQSKLADFEFSIDDIVLPEDSRLQKYHKDAWEAYQALPFPTLRDEPWRRTDIKGLKTTTFQIVDVDEKTAQPPKKLFEPVLFGEERGGQIVAGGVERSLTLKSSLKSKGVIFTDFHTAEIEHPNVMDRILGQVVSSSEDKFTALAAALGSEGVVLYVPKDVVIREPIHSLYWGSGENRAFINHIIVWLEDGAQVTFVHESASPKEYDDGQILHNGIVELYVGRNAKLNFVELQSWGENVWSFTRERARVMGNGSLEWIFGAMGTHLTKNFSDIDLVEPGAMGRMSGFYFASGDQHLDHDTQQNHLAPNTNSDLLYKGALLDESRSVWQGMIYVAPGAIGTDGYQANRNLILSKNAHADSIPGLEILADDVRCTHGATVGKIDEGELFYLQSRGIPKKEAEQLIVMGFFAPIMARIPFEGVQNRFLEAIQEKMID
jgi:Fe-S cluster assembly protein SufD